MYAFMYICVCMVIYSVCYVLMDMYACMKPFLYLNDKPKLPVWLTVSGLPKIFQNAELKVFCMTQHGPDFPDRKRAPDD